MANQILAIAPYWLDSIQTWVFDDVSVGLKQEPFVSGADTFLSHLVQNIPAARSGFRLLFSSEPFPGFQQKVSWERQEMGGNWYRAEDPPMEGWLCPALFRYFEAAPGELYVKAEPLRSGS